MKIQPNLNILAITGTTAIPVLVADRLLKYGYQMMQVQGISDVLKLPNQEDYFGVGIVSIDGQIELAELREVISGVAKIYPRLEFIVANHSGQSAKEIEELGIDVIDVVSFPFESEILVSRVFEAMPFNIPANRLSLDAVTQIHLPPIEDLDVLPFDIFVFLPLNNKAILYKKAGQRGFKSDLTRISFNKNAPLYIRRSDFQLYSNYLSKYMASVEDEVAVPEKLRVQVMQNRFTSVMRSFLAQSHEMQAEESSAMLDTVRKIASDFSQANSDNPILHDRIRMLIGRSINNYAHAMNVSAYCTIFGIMAGFSDTDSLSLGGLFHDIGLSELPNDISMKDYDELESDEDRELYLSHGIIGVEMIENRNIPISFEVKSMIEQHHHLLVEGGVTQLDEVHPFAQICAFADLFDELTSVRAGKKVYTPFEAIQYIAGMSEECSEPHPVYCAEVHEDIVQQFLLNEFEGEDILEIG